MCRFFSRRFRRLAGFPSRRWSRRDSPRAARGFLGSRGLSVSPSLGLLGCLGLGVGGFRTMLGTRSNSFARIGAGRREGVYGIYNNAEC